MCTVQIDTIDQGSRLSPATAGPAGDGRHHLQIPQQSGCGRLSLCLLFGSLAASLQKQRRLFENPGSHPGRAVAPGGVEFTRLAARELVCGERAGHLLAILQIGARHRDEELHGHVRGDPAFAYSLLDRVRKEFDQRQAPRDPTDTAVKAAGQFVQPVAEALFEFREQPSLLQGSFSLRCAQGLAEQESLGFVHRPHGCAHSVTTQPPQGRYPLVAVDDQVAVRFVTDGHDDNRHLLTRSRKRSQKPSLPVGTSNAQVFESKIELVKLQIHGGCPRSVR